VQRRFEAYLAGKPPPRQHVSSDSPMSASGSAASAPQSEPAEHGKPAKPGKKQQPTSAQPVSQDDRRVADHLVSALRDGVAACVAGGLLPEASYRKASKGAAADSTVSRLVDHSPIVLPSASKPLFPLSIRKVWTPQCIAEACPWRAGSLRRWRMRLQQWLAKQAALRHRLPYWQRSWQKT